MRARAPLTAALLVVALHGAAAFPLDDPSPHAEAPESDSLSVAPVRIDPLAEDAGDFLDIDLGPYRSRAALAYRGGRYLEAAAYYLFVLRHNYDDETSIYNLACCYALLGRAELAAKHLARAVNAGYHDIDHIRNDSDFDGVKGDPLFDSTLENVTRFCKGLGGTFHVEGRILLECRVHLPSGYDRNKRYPLVIGMHGNGGNPGEFARLWEHFENPRFIFVVPRAPYRRTDLDDYRIDGYSWEITVEDESLWERGDPLTPAYIVRVAEEAASRYRVSDVYLLGHSQGAAYAYVTGIKHPEIFSGVVAVAGLLPSPEMNYSILTNDEIRSASGLRVLIIHGERDRSIEYQAGLDAKKKLELLGYRVVFRSFDGGHAFPVFLLGDVERWIEGEDE